MGGFTGPFGCMIIELLHTPFVGEFIGFDGFSMDIVPIIANEIANPHSSKLCQSIPRKKGLFD